jgi:hypothetical protein
MTAKADRAKELLNDPIIVGAFESVRQRLLQMFEACDSNDPATMQDISKRLNLLEAVKSDLEKTVADGTFEDFQVAEIERLRSGYNGA